MTGNAVRVTSVMSRLTMFMQSDALSPYCPRPRSSRSLKEKKKQRDPTLVGKETSGIFILFEGLA